MIIVPIMKQTHEEEIISLTSIGQGASVGGEEEVPDNGKVRVTVFSLFLTASAYFYSRRCRKRV